MSDNIISLEDYEDMFNAYQFIFEQQKKIVFAYQMDCEQYQSLQQQYFLIYSTFFFETPSLISIIPYLISVSLTDRVERNSDGHSFSNYHYWEVSHPFLTDDDNPRTSYRAMYRMDRTTLERLINELSEHPIYISSQVNALPVHIQISCAIWRLANCHVGYRIAQMTMGVSHGSYTNFTRRFVRALRDMYRHIIAWPTDEQSALRIRNGFLSASTSASCRLDPIGAIDGKNVIIHARNTHPEEWRDRHGNFSMKLTAICDDRCRFTYIRVGDSGKYNN